MRPSANGTRPAPGGMRARAARIRRQSKRLVPRALDVQSLLLQPSWQRPRSSSPTPRLGVVCVSYNTFEYTSLMLWSLRRIADSSWVDQIVVVDNGSEDGSLELLRCLEERGVLTLIPNRLQRLHGPGLNQGIRDLARRQADGRVELDQLLVVDSDVMFLRPDAITAPALALRRTGAALLGENHDRATAIKVPGGYAHISCLFIDPVQVVQRGVPPFLDRGHPGVTMQCHLRSVDAGIENFPLRSERYVLHAESATLMHLQQSGSSGNTWATWAKGRPTITHRFHGNADGATILEEMRRRFRDEVPDLRPESVASAIASVAIAPR